MQPEINQLENYYFSEQWKVDFEASNRGEIPKEIPHGVLSEGLVYNLIATQQSLAIQYLKWMAELLERK